MKDSSILASCLDSRDAFDKIVSHVDTKEFTPLGEYWWPYIVDWYKRDNKASSVDRDILCDKGSRSAPTKQKETLVKYFKDIPTDTSPENIVTELLDVKRTIKGMELSAAISEGSTKPTKINKLLEDYKELLTATEFKKSEIQYAANLDELDSIIDKGNKIALVPKQLNERIGGGMLPGDFMILFARPETGKSLVCVAQVCNFLKQKKKVLYIGNEDGIHKLKARVRCNLANMTAEQVDKYKEEANRRASKKGIDTMLVMVHLHPGTVEEIEELVKEHEPDVLVIDQIRNLKVAGVDGMVASLNEVGQQVRNLLGKYNLVGIGVTQANGSAGLWLNMEDVDSSKTGLPAQADLLVGIGTNQDMNVSGNRTVSICKNKLTGNHEGFIMQVDTQRNKVRD